MNLLETINKFRGPLGRALASQALPHILQGAILEALKQKQVTVKILSDWVNNDTKLWSMLFPYVDNKVRDIVQDLGPYDWLTSKWLVNSIRKERPELASLLISWKKSSNWLERQVKDIKSQFEY